MKIGILLQIWVVKLAFPQYWRLPSALVYAQAKHETGNFKSDIYIENNSLFGMKVPRKRKTTVKGEGRGHATYSSRISSIYDYFLRQQYFHISYITVQQYIEKTKQSAYAEDTKYDERWKAHYDSISPVFRAIPYLFIPAVAIIALFIFRRDLFDDMF